MATLTTRSGFEIQIDNEDAKVLDEWAYCSVCQVKDQAGEVHYKYAVLFSHRDEHGGRRMTYLAREILGITDGEQEVYYKNGDGLDCRRENLGVRRRSWAGRRRNAKRPIPA